MKWIHLVQNEDLRQDFVNAVTYLRRLKQRSSFFTIHGEFSVGFVPGTGQALNGNKIPTGTCKLSLQEVTTLMQTRP
jgi:hypothetical protein